MKRYILATAAALLAFPASGLAAAPNGVVLSVDARDHAIQVVDSKHVVHLYHYRGRLPRLHPGSGGRFDRSGPSNGVVKVRHGIIAEIGIANRSPTRTVRQKRRFLSSFRPFL